MTDNLNESVSLMFETNTLVAAVSAFTITDSQQRARLNAWHELAETESATFDDIALALRDMAARISLNIAPDGELKPSQQASLDLARERVTGFSDATLRRYETVLAWLAQAECPLSELSDSAVSALVQLASGAVGARKSVSDAIMPNLKAKNSDKLVATYRRLLSAKKASAKARQARAGKAKGKSATKADSADSVMHDSETLTPAQVAETLDPLALATILRNKVLHLESIDSKLAESLQDALIEIGALIEDATASK